VAGDRAVVGASTAGDRGRKVGDELTSGVGGTERGRERARVRKESRRQTWPMGQREREGERARGLAQTNLAHGAAREREGAWVGADMRDPPVKHRGRAGTGLGLMGQPGVNWLFYFPGNL
jgi:hypothetical protein